MKNLKIRNEFIAFLVIFILGFAAYSNSLKGDFVWDDEVLVKENLNIKDWSKTLKFFIGDSGTKIIEKGIIFRPVQMASYSLDYSFWGINSIGYHLTNVILHILVVFAAYVLVKLLFNSKTLSFLTSILFIVHPVHTEAISYISGRADPLAALFILSCVILYIKQSTLLKNTTSYFLILISYVFALLSKEYSLVTPLLLFIYSYTFNKKLLFKEFFSVLIISFSYVLLRLFIIPTHAIATSNLFQRIPGFFIAITEYLKLLLIPLNLHMEYGNKLFNFYNVKVILGLIITILIFTYAFIKRKSDKLIFFSIFWFFICLLPVSNLFPVNAYMAEHWLYLPSIGFFILLANIFALLYKVKIKYFKFVTIILVACLVAVYFITTIKQNNYWRNNLSFGSHTLQYAPDSTRLHALICQSCIKIGEIKTAEIFCRRAMEIDPNNPNAYSLLGVISGSKGLYNESIAYFKQAIKLEPTYIFAYNGLGVSYILTNNFIEAKRVWGEGLKIDPDSLLLKENLKKLESDENFKTLLKLETS